MMTGMHAFHVFTGLILLAIVWINGRRGLYDEKNYPVEAAAVYWHFVDVVWIFFYPALYLIGTAVKVAADRILRFSERNSNRGDLSQVAPIFE